MARTESTTWRSKGTTSTSSVRRGPSKQQLGLYAQGLEGSGTPLSLSQPPAETSFLRRQDGTLIDTNHRGDSTIATFSFTGQRIRAVIFSVKDLSAEGLSAFTDFRGRARSQARVFGVPELELQGLPVRNPKIEALLQRQGSTPKLGRALKSIRSTLWPDWRLLWPTTRRVHG